MKLGKNCISIFTILLTIALLTGCAQPQPQETTAEAAEAPLEYVKTILTYGGPNDGWRVELDNMTYSFAGIAPREEWDGMVVEAQAVVQSLEDRFGKVPGRHTLCTLFKPCKPWKVREVMYIDKDSFKTQEYAVSIAQMLYGNEVNYGLLYALGTEISGERGYPVEKLVPLEEALSLCDTSPVYLDMNYACFLENYSDEETLQKVKALACGFFSSLTDGEKADLLMDYSDEKYCRYLSRFLETNGKSAFDNSDLGGTRFYNGPEGTRLIWENDAATFFVDDDYQAVQWLDGMSVDVVNGDYSQLRQLVVDYRIQADWLRQRIGKYATTKKLPEVVFRNGRAQEDGGRAVFRPGGRIYMSDHVPFAHEYVHYLTWDMQVTGALSEMLAHYYTYMPGDPQIAYTWMEDKTSYEYFRNVDFQGKEVFYAVYDGIEEHLGHEIDWSSPEDYAFQQDACIAAYDAYNIANNTTGGIDKASFTRYLVSLKDEATMLEAIYNNSPEKCYGKTWEELRLEWETLLETEFAWTKEIVGR